VAFPHGRTALHPPQASIVLAGVCVLLGFVGALGAYFVAEAGLTAAAAIAAGTILLALAMLALAYFTYLTAAAARDQMAMLNRQVETQRLGEMRGFLEESLYATLLTEEWVTHLKTWVESRGATVCPDASPAAAVLGPVVYRSPRWLNESFYPRFRAVVDHWDNIAAISDDVARGEVAWPELAFHCADLDTAVTRYRTKAVEDLAVLAESTRLLSRTGEAERPQ
jgi:hypothetical protein